MYSHLVPDVAYHGSPNRTLTELRSEAEVLGDINMNHAIYFARTVKEAAQYVGAEGRIYMARLRIRRPLISDIDSLGHDNPMVRRFFGTFVSLEDKLLLYSIGFDSIITMWSWTIHWIIFEQSQYELIGWRDAWAEGEYQPTDHTRRTTALAESLRIRS